MYVLIGAGVSREITFETRKNTSWAEIKGIFGILSFLNLEIYALL